MFVATSMFGQELNSRVIVNANQIQTTERVIFQDMENDFSQFLNTTKWTGDTFNKEEVINCNIIININKMPNISLYEATVQVLSSRPVYGTNYESVLFNFADKNWKFEYVQSQPIRFNENVFTDNLSSLLAFYAYVIIGLDYDSFSELGGNPHFEKAFNIVNNAQQSNYPAGWTQFKSTKNRYWLIENLQSPQLEPIRKTIYNYHINGLDILIDRPEEARKNILFALSEISKANRIRPRSILTVSFMHAKATELTQLFTKTNLVTRRQAYNLLNTIDPARSEDFKVLIE